MRSLRPDPRNPWPHDMVITIEDAPSALLELLWVREAWQLEPTGDVPPPLVDAPGPVDAHVDADADARDTSEWTEAWSSLWTACLAHAAEVPAPSLHDHVTATAGGSPERRALLQRIFGPSWNEQFGTDTLGESYRAWSTRHMERQLDRIRAVHRLDEEPERRSLDALVPAWRAGFSRIVVIPCRGTFTRTIGPHALLVTGDTRDDPASYSAALAGFTPPAP